MHEYLFFWTSEVSQSFEFSQVLGLVFALACNEQEHLKQQHFIFSLCCECGSSVVSIFGSDFISVFNDVRASFLK